MPVSCSASLSERMENQTLGQNIKVLVLALPVAINV